jgi:myo-inositol-1(or 4)-monophosphatase
VRRLGSAALDAAYVAAGRLEGYWESIVKPWDVAAGWLLVEEAGGRVTDLSGGPFGVERGEILATNGPLHPLLIEALAELDRSTD